MFFILSFSANIPFFGVGFLWGLPSIIILTVWCGLTWHYEDDPFFLMAKIWFMGFFVVSVVELTRQYPLLESLGTESFITRLKWSIGLSLISVMIAGIFAYVLQRIFHLSDRISNALDLWIQKETRIYKKTWIYRKIVRLQNKIHQVQRQTLALVHKIKRKLNRLKTKIFK